MARQRFVESIWTGEGSKRFEVKDVSKAPKRVQERFEAVRKNKRLNESTMAKPSDDVVRAILKKHNLSEAAIDNIVKDMNHRAGAVVSESGNVKRLWRFPISKINDAEHPNLNNRVYTRELWENVINNQQHAWKGRCGLADHPQGDASPSFKDQGILWLDGEIDDNVLDEETGLPYVFGYGVFVGPYGKMAEEILDYGGGVGFSSSGYGDYVGQSNIVDAGTFEIERFADMVTDPSQGVFGYAENVVENIEPKNTTKSTQVNESVEKHSENKNAIKENRMENLGIKSPKATAGVMLGYYSNTLKEIEEMKSTDKRIAAYTDLISDIDNGFDEEWLKNEGAKIAELREKAAKALEADTEKYQEAASIADNFDGTTEELSEMVKNATQNEKDLVEIRKVMAESNRLLASTQKENTALHGKVESLSTAYKEDMKAARSETREMKSKVESLNQNIIAATKVINQLNRALREAIADNAKLEESAIKYRNAAKHYFKEAEDAKAKAKRAISSSKKRANDAMAEAAGYRKDLSKAKKALAEKEEIINDYSDYTTSTKHTNTFNRAFCENDEIAGYVEDLKSRPDVNISEELENDLLQCKTLSEAQSMFLRKYDLFAEEEEAEDQTTEDQEDNSEEEDAEAKLDEFVAHFE